MSEIAERRNARAASVRSRVLKGSRFNYEQATIAGCVFANPLLPDIPNYTIKPQH